MMPKHCQAILDDMLAEALSASTEEVAEARLDRCSGFIEYAYLTKDLTDPEFMLIRSRIAGVRASRNARQMQSRRIHGHAEAA